MTHHAPTLRPRLRHPLPILSILLGAVLLFQAPSAQAAEHSLGLGAHFFRTVDSIRDLEGIDDDGNSWVVSYQYLPRGIFKFQADLEYFEKGFSGSTEASFAPQIFVLIGHGLYGGIGVGQTISDDLEDEMTDPYFMARFGWELALLGAVSVDIQGTYLFDNWDAVGGFDIETDTLTLGAVIRFNL